MVARRDSVAVTGGNGFIFPITTLGPECYAELKLNKNETFWIFVNSITAG